VKTTNEIEVPELYYERNPLITIGSVLLSGVLCFTSIYLFRFSEFEMHGWALLLIPPALFSSFQSLIFILNPYVLLYKDRMEIKASMISNKIWYYNDIKKVSEAGEKSLKITYNDDDEETIRFSGIKASHIQPLRNSLHKFVYEGLEKRDD